MTFGVAERTLKTILRVGPTRVTREMFSPLVLHPPMTSAFVFPRNKILLAGGYQSKQYHVAGICPFCHGKLGRCSRLCLTAESPVKYISTKKKEA